MAKLKLDPLDLEPTIHSGIGLVSPLGILSFCFHLNEHLVSHKISRLKEDIYLDFKQIRFYYRLYGAFFRDIDQDLRLVENRSYNTLGDVPHEAELFTESIDSEKKWLNTKETYSFFLWFEGEKENVNFTLTWVNRLKSLPFVHQAKALDPVELRKLNKSVKYSNVV
jgi:hypothetical protein